jgi:hypothetical protein
MTDVERTLKISDRMDGAGQFWLRLTRPELAALCDVIGQWTTTAHFDGNPCLRPAVRKLLDRKHKDGVADVEMTYGEIKQLRAAGTACGNLAGQIAACWATAEQDADSLRASFAAELSLSYSTVGIQSNGYSSHK